MFLPGVLIILPFLFYARCTYAGGPGDVAAARSVIVRICGENIAARFDLVLDRTMPGNDAYSVTNSGNRIWVKGNSQVALCRGAYDYLSNACHSIVSWSGDRISLPQRLPAYYHDLASPYRYRYYMNVVTHGYSAPYWDERRWDREMDWMAVHGINMPLLSGAFEAILYRVFRKLGLSEQESMAYFTGPAHFPWNRMGNITGWDGPFPAHFFARQLALNHHILDRAKSLGMHPIVPAFAGFVPESIHRLFPDEQLKELNWGGFGAKYNAHILAPGSALFGRIGSMFIQEWKAEFGKAEFYLADSFNEMDVPLPQDSAAAHKELAGYGKAVFSSIHATDPDATWVMQGWTFPYQQDAQGKLFWTQDRLHALLSEVPDDKLLILDLANEYNRLWWKSSPSWKLYHGFFGKEWIYSFIPNMGGKVSLNGDLHTYASIPVEALQYGERGRLAGFGFAPEGIENNEIIYELLSDMGWSDKEIDLDNWIAAYCRKRYGVYPENMKRAFDCFRNSCFGSFTDHPRQAYQFRPGSNIPGTVNRSDSFGKGVALFLSCKDLCRGNKLYTDDAIEFVVQYLGLQADSLLSKTMQGNVEDPDSSFRQAMTLLTFIDRLLESHPNHRLQRWVDYARAYGDTPAEKNYYESNAKRLITTWGGGVNEYAARTWGGLIRDYYIPRWKQYYDAKKSHAPFDMKAWEERWIETPGVSPITPFRDPVTAMCAIFDRHY